MIEAIFFAVVAGCFLLTIMFIIFAITQIIKLPQKTAQKKRSRNLRPLKPDHELRRCLLGMLGGNNDSAERLVNLARRQNPGRGETWYWEKAISDLERDRR